LVVAAHSLVVSSSILTEVRKGIVSTVEAEKGSGIVASYISNVLSRGDCDVSCVKRRWEESSYVSAVLSLNARCVLSRRGSDVGSVKRGWDDS